MGCKELCTLSRANAKQTAAKDFEAKEESTFSQVNCERKFGEGPKVKHCLCGTCLQLQRVFDRDQTVIC